MTKEDIVIMFEKRISGATLEEIGKEFGVTRERVRQILEANVKNPVIKKSSGCKCIYPALTEWMMTNGCSGYKLCHESGVSRTMVSFYNKLQGKNPFTITEIKQILAYTGMTFEEAFGTVEANGGEQ